MNRYTEANQCYMCEHVGPDVKLRNTDLPTCSECSGEQDRIIDELEREDYLHRWHGELPTFDPIDREEA